MYNDLQYLKIAFGAVVGAAIAIPSIAAGYYFIYLAVTAVGN